MRERTTDIEQKSKEIQMLASSTATSKARCKER